MRAILIALVLLLGGCASSPFGPAETQEQRGYRLGCRMIYVMIPAGMYVNHPQAKPGMVANIRQAEQSAYTGMTQAITALRAGSDTAVALLTAAGIALSDFSILIIGTDKIPTSGGEALSRAPVYATVALTSAARMRAWRISACQTQLELSQDAGGVISDDAWNTLEAAMQQNHELIQN